MRHFTLFGIPAFLAGLLLFPNLTLAGEVPDDLRGHYVSLGECALFEQSDAALTVSAGKLQFYESSCDLEVSETQENGFSGAYVCQGEGQSWLMIYKIKSVAGGIEVSSKGLDFNGALSERTSQYKRCD